MKNIKPLYNNRENNNAREFSMDFRRFQYLNNCFELYSKNPLNTSSKDLRLMLNNIIILYNVFNRSTNDLLKTYIKLEYYPFLNSFLFVLGNIDSSPVDNNLVEILKKVL